MLLAHWWPALFGVLFCLGFYCWSYWGTERIAGIFVQRLHLARKIPLRLAIMIMRMALYGLPGTLVYLSLALIHPALVIPFHVTLVGIVGGAFLGLGYAAAGSTVAQGIVLIKHRLIQRKNKGNNPFTEFEALGFTGWMRGYSLARTTWPRVSFFLAAFTIAGEELAFRGVALPLLLHSLGFIPALLFTVVAFMGIQVITMPSWEPALAPVSSSLIIGIIQACLAVGLPNMLPLIVSHYCFFVILQIPFSPPSGPFLGAKPMVRDSFPLDI